MYSRVHWDNEVYLTVKSDSDYLIIIHNKYDLPQSGFLHPSINIDDDWMSNQKLIIRNKKISKQSTKLRPCQKFWQRTCQEIERQEKIAKEYNCSVPIYYTGEHLTKVTKSITSVTCKNHTV